MRPLESVKLNTIDDVLANAASALAIATNFGSILPIPIVVTVIGSAQIVIQTAQTIRQNRRNCAELAIRVARLVQLIHEHTSGHVVEKHLESALEILDSDFKEIQQFILTQDGLNVFQRIIKRSSIDSETKRLVSGLDFSLRFFETGSHLRAETTLCHVSNEILTLNQTLQHERKYHGDGQFRFYRQCEVRLVQKLSHPSLSSADNLSWVGTACDQSRGEYYIAEVEGKVATVIKKRITVESNPSEKTNDAVANLGLMRRFFHPNIAQLQGWSDSDKMHFYVVHGELLPVTLFFASLCAEKRAQALLNVLIGVYSGILHLYELQIYTSWKLGDLMLDKQTSNVIVGSSGVFNNLTYEMPPPNTTSVFIPAYKGTDATALRVEKILSDNLTPGNTTATTFEDVIGLWSKFGLSVSIAWEDFQYLSDYYIQCLQRRGIITVNAWDDTNIATSCIGSLKLVGADPTMVGLHHDQVWPPKLRCKKHDQPEPEPTSSNSISAQDLHMPPNALFTSARYHMNEGKEQATRDFLSKAVGISRRFGVPLTEIRRMYYSSFIFAAERGQDSNTERPVYLHVRPLEPDGSLPSPWGYYSFSKEPTKDGEDIMMKRDDNPQGLLDRSNKYQSTLPGVRASVNIGGRFEILCLSDLQAEFLAFLHNHFPHQK